VLPKKVQKNYTAASSIFYEADSIDELAKTAPTAFKSS
jgi:hypothetical protein